MTPMFPRRWECRIRSAYAPLCAYRADVPQLSVALLMAALSVISDVSALSADAKSKKHRRLEPVAEVKRDFVWLPVTVLA